MCIDSSCEFSPMRLVGAEFAAVAAKGEPLFAPRLWYAGRLYMTQQRLIYVYVYGLAAVLVSAIGV